MRRRFLLVLPLAALFACGDDGSSATEEAGTTTSTTTTTAVAAVDDCTRAQESVGVLDPPTDLVEVAAMAALVAELASAPDEPAPEDPLHTALTDVSDAAALLADAARAGEPPAIGDAAATLTAAYDQLDDVAADLQRSECSSESWGRQVVIAAIDLTGAAG